jgi:hypothetical protein
MDGRYIRSDTRAIFQSFGLIDVAPLGDAMDQGAGQPRKPASDRIDFA